MTDNDMLFRQLQLYLKSDKHRSEIVTEKRMSRRFAAMKVAMNTILYKAGVHISTLLKVRLYN